MTGGLRIRTPATTYTIVSGREKRLLHRLAPRTVRAICMLSLYGSLTSVYVLLLPMKRKQRIRISSMPVGVVVFGSTNGHVMTVLPYYFVAGIWRGITTTSISGVFKVLLNGLQ